MLPSESQEGPNIALITIICSWIFLFVALLSVIIWFWLRRIRKLRLGLDDYLIILALATTIALVAQTTWAIVDEGQDQHQAELSSKKFTVVVRSLLVNQTLWGLVNTFVRMSAILLIENCFPVLTVGRIARSVLVLSILYGLVVILEVFLICRPLAVDWNPYVDGKCADQIVSYLVLEILGLLIDLTILITPLPVIAKLHMDWRRKMSIAAVFSIGALVFIITGLRIQALNMANAQDFTYSKGYLGLLSALGASLGITFCCSSAIYGVYRGYQQWRKKLLELASRLTHVNERSSAVISRHPNEISSPTNKNDAAHTHRGSTIWRVFEYRHFNAYLKRAPALPVLYHQWRKSSLERALRPTRINERSTAVISRHPNEISSPTNKNDAAHTHRGSTIWPIFEYRHFKSYFRRARKAIITDEEETAAASETHYEISWPVVPGCPIRY